MDTKDNILNIAKKDYNEELVLIDTNAINQMIWPDNASHLPTWDWIINQEMKTCPNPNGALMFWLLGVAQAFMFWERLPDGTIKRYIFNDHSGTNALFTALANTWGDGLTPKCLRHQQINRALFTQWFGRVPGIDDRVEIMNEMLIGQKLEHAVDYFIHQAKTGTLNIDDALWLSNEFPKSFGGDAYLKKAQLYCTAVAGFLSTKDIHVKTDLTAMADYQVPRVLKAMGILHYSPSLDSLINAGDLLLAGSKEERAIRAATVLACESISSVHGIESAVVDSVLWASQDLAGDSRFHLTLTANY
ncbi:MAG: queuosine salvage family protein [Methylococcales bacterium]